ncbi:kinase [Pseudoalteromonas sp. CO348]|uniref:phosphotransferase n=1 Tax=Pseudoalteromonas TaxID=53246 RepID=UPI001022D28E|nr:MULTISPECIES: phosphotransferase [Pseudoalteromonas]MCG7539289.1 aminoglycoside phosphotransferase family protein [Pseudoalteromonas sp. OF7H-1]RZF99729.1 kinase [Pseudoalteromonas sp. CO348]WMO16470.1 aminoglycoside phosphotransferase family protein [Pseudoalteromonas piscicida]
MKISIPNDVISAPMSTQQEQQLWSGCGDMLFINHDAGKLAIKRTKVPSDIAHRRIAQSSVALARKAKSYQVERHFYKHHACELLSPCNTPSYLGEGVSEGMDYIVFRDFSTQGFSQTANPSESQILAVIGWLAKFHAHFLQSPAEHVWEQGNYWHLDTRPDELERMQHSSIKQAAPRLRDRIKNSHWHTWIHGDAKLANFAFNGDQALGFDFQYVGKGIGVSDLMLFITSVLDEKEQLLHADEYLKLYLDMLRIELLGKAASIDIAQILSEWESLWPVVWADFYRFLLGWKPDHVKINDYMKFQTEIALQQG